jgi:hypothetical protein
MYHVLLTPLIFLPIFTSSEQSEYCMGKWRRWYWRIVWKCKEYDNKEPTSMVAWSGVGSAAARWLGLWLRIPPKAWMSVSCNCWVLPGRSLCDGLITRPEGSYRVLCVWVWLWNPDMMRPWSTRGCCAMGSGKGGVGGAMSARILLRLKIPAMSTRGNNENTGSSSP